MKTQSPDTSPEAGRVLIETIRRMSPQEKVQLAGIGTWLVKSLLWHDVQQRNPNGSQRELRHGFSVRWLGREIADRIFATEDWTRLGTSLLELQWAT